MENQQTSEKLPTSKDVIAYLAECFPHCFSAQGEAKPLKIGIFEDLASRLQDDPKVSKTRLRAALRQYTNSWRYLRYVTEGAERVDLDGGAAGIVEKDHADHAGQLLAESKERAAQRRKEQQKEQQREQRKEQPATDAKAAQRKSRPKPQGQRSAQAKSRAGAADSVKKTAKVLAPLDQASVAVGQEVQVKVGQAPIAGTVTAVEKSDIQVQLVSGITVRVKVENLFSQA